MDTQQISTTQNQTTENKSEVVELVDGVTVAQDEYIAFVALGGLIPDPTGATVGVRMTAGQLADRLDVERTTLYYWRKSIPDFWDRVNAKRKAIGSKERLSNVWNGVYLRAAKGDAEQAKLFLANFDDNFRMPMERRENNAGDGLADLLATKLLQKAKEESQKRTQVIDVEPSDSSNA